MFSELLFLRFNGVLIQRAEYLIEHIEKFHVAGDRRCCVNRADNLHAMFVAINKVVNTFKIHVAFAIRWDSIPEKL